MLTYQVASVWAGNSTIKGSVTVSDIEFGYNETKYGNAGAGNRGIRIYVKEGRDQTYKFDPNPHGDRWYNKYQKDFYKTAAEDLGNYYVSHSNKFPRYEKHSVEIHDVEYNLISP